MHRGIWKPQSGRRRLEIWSVIGCVLSEMLCSRKVNGDEVPRPPVSCSRRHAATMTIFMTGGFRLGAQEGSAAKSQSTKSKQVVAPASKETNTTGKTAPPDVTHRVPPGYSKLGLTDQQKDKLYKIQAEYYPKIQALEKQSDQLAQKKREKEFECSVLAARRKRLLAEAEQQKKAAAEAKKAAVPRLPPRKKRVIEIGFESRPRRARDRP